MCEYLDVGVPDQQIREVQTILLDGTIGHIESLGKEGLILRKEVRWILVVIHIKVLREILDAVLMLDVGEE